MPAFASALGFPGALARAPAPALPLYRVRGLQLLQMTAADPAGAQQKMGAVFVDEEALWKQQPKKYQQGRYRAMLLKRARDFLRALSSSAAGSEAASLISEGFQFLGVARDNRVLTTDDFLRSGTTAVGGGAMEYYGFSIDPFEPKTVWFTAREPSGKGAAPQPAYTCSLTFEHGRVWRVARFTMHSIAIVAETRGITVDADALRAEVGAVEEEEDALLMLVEEEGEAPRALAAAPSAAEQLEKLEAELARLQQLCDAQEGEMRTYKKTEAASSTRLEGACKMMEQASARMQTLENDKARLEGELHASEEQRKTFETTIMAHHAAELRALGETLAQAQLSAEKLKMDLRDALAAAVEAEKKTGLALERANKERTVWDAVLLALSGKPPQTRSQKLFNIVFSCTLLVQMLVAGRSLADQGQDEQMDKLATQVFEVKNQILRHHTPFATSQPTSASTSTSASAVYSLLAEREREREKERPAPKDT